MERLKNIIYDKSDIIIAFAILLIAGLLIAWRLGAIMEYPKQLISQNDHSTEISTEEKDTKDDSSEKDTDKSDKSEKDNSTKAEGTALWSSDGYLTKDVTVTFSGSAASHFVQCAIDAGLLESYDEYTSICSYQGISDPDIINPPIGEYTFSAGSSKADVVLRIKG